MLGQLTRAGHTQFVDQRRRLNVDVCTSGKDTDAAVREVALAVTGQWVHAALESSNPDISSSRGRSGATAASVKGNAAFRHAAESLRERQFEAAVEWSSFLA